MAENPGTTNADVIVVGLGAVGSAALYHLAKSGASVIGVDRFSPPHSLGSTHGDTRITRQGIGEGLAYVPLALRSHELWRELERETGTSLLTQCGGLFLTQPGKGGQIHGKHGFVERSIEAAEAFDIDHEVLTATAINARFPQFQLSGDEIGYYEPGAGFLRPEACVAAYLAAAEEHGATVVRNTVVRSVTSTPTGVETHTANATHRAKTAIIAAGPWIGDLVSAPLQRLFTVSRMVLCWFEIARDVDQLLPEHMPVFIWQVDADRSFYGFPAIDGPDGGIKMATETPSPPIHPSTVNREIAPSEPGDFYSAMVRSRFPQLSGGCTRAVTCMYTITPDGDFVIDCDPQRDNVLVASPCCGHGFKHSPAVGEALAQWAMAGNPPPTVAPFSLTRFAE